MLENENAKLHEENLTLTLKLTETQAKVDVYERIMSIAGSKTILGFSPAREGDN